MASDKINVAVETAVHNTFAEVAQNVYRLYGVRVNQVVLEWSDIISHVGEDAQWCVTVRMNTEKVFDVKVEPPR